MPTDNSITVTARASISSPPDIAFTTLFLRTDGILLSDAVHAADEKCASLATLLRTQFPAITDIKIISLKLGDKGDGWRSGEKSDPPRPEVVRCLLLLTPVDVPLQIKLVDFASRHGLLLQNPASQRTFDNPNIFYYGHAAPTDHHAQAVAAAIANARIYAQTIATPLAKSATRPTQITVANPCRESYNVRYDSLSKHFPAHHYSDRPDAVPYDAEVTVTFDLE